MIAYDDFVVLGSEAKCKEAGKLRLEGKDYIVQDGDIIHFRFAIYNHFTAHFNMTRHFQSQRPTVPPLSSRAKMN